MEDQFSRISLMFGQRAVEKLHQSKVAVFGIGGVGGFAAEALARSGIGTLDLIDNDKVCLSNLNRQIIATHETIGKFKTEVMRERVLSIYPDINVNIQNCFFLPENAHEFDFSAYDYVIDAVDTVTAKIQLVLSAQAAGTPIISCMGAGNKLDPTRFQVADIYETSVCPLAKVMRRELKRREVSNLKVVYSTEPPFCSLKPEDQEKGQMLNRVQATELAIERQENITVSDSDEIQNGSTQKVVPGSIAFVPSVAGLIMAGEVIKELILWSKDTRNPHVSFPDNTAAYS